MQFNRKCYRVMCVHHPASASGGVGTELLLNVSGGEAEGVENKQMSEEDRCCGSSGC